METSEPVLPLADSMKAYRSQNGVTLAGLSDASPVLVVFLRHLG